MITKQKATYLEYPIEVGDIIQESTIDGKDDEVHRYLIVSIIGRTYEVLDLEDGQLLIHAFQYHPTVQYKKVG